MTFWDWMEAHMSTALFWQACAFFGVVMFVVWLNRTQKSTQNQIDFFQLVYEPGSNPPKLAPERFAFVGAFVVTSIGFIFGVTRPNATVDGISFLMGTYGALWVAGAAVKKFGDRAPAPVVQAPAPVIQVGPQVGSTTGGDNSGGQQQ